MTIDEAKLREAFAALQARVAYLERASGLFASDEEMAGPRGDPQVKFSPRAWKGPIYVGKHYSECEPDFLEALAEALAWSADHPKEGREKYAQYDRIDARRCRTWARRLRAGGWTPPPKAAEPERPAGRPSGDRPGGGRRPTGQRPGRPARGATPPAESPPADPTPAPAPSEPRPNSPADVGFDPETGEVDDDFLDEGDGDDDNDPLFPDDDPMHTAPDLGFEH